MTRLEANLQILKKIEKVVLNNPDIRFTQLLIIMNLVPKDVVAVMDSFYFYEESETTLKNIKE